MQPSRGQPINIASPHVTAAIMTIEPSRSPYNETFWPCELLLNDGRVIPRVICRENARWSDKGKWIHPERIVEVRPSCRRLPAALATKLYSSGESGMGYTIYVLELKSGQSFPVVSGGIFDFPPLLNGAFTEDILDVHPHLGRELAVSIDIDFDIGFEWCDFVPYSKNEIKT